MSPNSALSNLTSVEYSAIVLDPCSPFSMRLAASSLWLDFKWNFLKAARKSSRLGVGFPSYALMYQVLAVPSRKKAAHRAWSLIGVSESTRYSWTLNIQDFIVEAEVSFPLNMGGLGGLGIVDFCCWG